MTTTETTPNMQSLKVQGGRQPRGRGVDLLRMLTAASVCALILAGSFALPALTRPQSDANPSDSREASAEHGDGSITLNVAGGRIDVVYTPSDFNLPPATIEKWIRDSAIATSTYFGRFPIRRVTIRLRAVGGDDVTGGSATAEPGARINLNIGRDTNERTLFRDSTAVHEMTHLAIPDHHERHLWFHEGIATYVETVARAQAGQITAERAWGELSYGMASGVAEGDDEQGLDDTENWDRRYWGGAIFFLMADIEIRQRTSNRLGLQDSLRALQKAGGDLSSHWDFDRILRIADRGIGQEVMQRLYRTLARRDADRRIDRAMLAALWRDLGVVAVARRRVSLDDRAPLAALRKLITSRPSEPLLVTAPRQIGEGQAPQRQAQRRTSSWPVLQRVPEVVRRGL